MKTLTADDSKRIRIPDAKPRQVFAYANDNGTIILTPVKAESKPRFPKGSLLHLFTGKAGRERAEREEQIFRATVQGPDPDYYPE
jgi:hypothetical protein